LRGLAAFAVVLWHYQHFFFVAPDRLTPGFVRSALPFYSIFWPFYEYGAFAVEIFFVLSGFVFYFVYSNAIKTGKVSAYEFTIFRFSRLYPLHFVTLIFVAALQYLSRFSLGSSIVYSNNDAWDFLLNIFFVSHWGLERGLSFNGPTWSVSIEILLYVGFFALVSFAGRSLLTAALAMVVGFFLGKYTKGSISDIGWGFYCFFAGGIAFIAWEKLRYRLTPLLLLLTAILVLILSVSICYEFFRTRYAMMSLFGGFLPSAVFLLAAVQNAWHDAGRRLRLVGNITYATYLLHFPIQLTIIYITTYYGVVITYNDPFMIILFLAIVIGISIPTYYLFERPAQSFLRDRFISRAAAVRRRQAGQMLPAKDRDQIVHISNIKR
jgi:peptidoglycan/LPS O-acetylase OafA/YrhL